MATIWNGWYWHLGLASLLAMSGAIAPKSDCAHAQITPDSTLGAESSVVTPNVDINGLPSDRIDGGSIRGANLFHSFQEFNIGEGRGAYFTNPGAIANILSRVTGNDVSDIFGKLGVLGNANLFLINPQGIIFGPNASLDIGGSFVGTTANAIGFGNQGFFSASTPDVAPVLTVNPSAFFFNQIATGPIINRAASTTTAAENLTGVLRDPGLQVPQGQSLLLVGGDVRLEGGHMQAQGGRVELGGLASPGSIGLAMNGSQSHLSFPDGVARADVYLVPRADGYLTEEDSNTAWVNVASSNGGSGSIAITARNINITQGALRGGIEQDSRFPGAQAGDFSLNATGVINVITSLINNRVRPRAVGNGGNINITTGSLSMTNGARLNTATSSQGNAGSVNIDARDTVSFNGVGSNLAEPESGAFSDVASEEAVGNGGDINITTGSLSVTNGAILSANTNGSGNAGNVNINARESVSFDGVGGSNGYSSAGYSSVREDGVGNGGDINITTGSLSVTNGAILSAYTNGPGNAGSININARESVSFDGVGGSNEYPSAAYSSVENQGVGNGGDINIKTGSLSVTNAAYLDAGTAGQGDAGSVIINARDTVSFDDGYTYSSVDEGAVGNGGDINITTGSLSLMNRGGLIASSEGSGAAGNIEVAANSIRLNNEAFLSSNTIAGEGNISLRSGDLVLRGESFITTNATGTAEGGNININSDVIAAFENSDISADSANSSGGRVTVNAQGIFGTEFRNQRTPLSDITATGGSPELSGRVEINNPDVDPTQGLVELPVELVDVSNQIATGCPDAVRRGESKFIVTGRGGLPPNPYEPLRGDNVLANWSTLDSDVENRSSAAPDTNSTIESAPTTTVEANGWVKSDNGEVILVATAPTANIDIPWLPESSCNAPEPES